MASDSLKAFEPLETSRGLHISALTFALLLPTVSTVLYFIVLAGSPLMNVLYFVSKVVQFAFPVAWVWFVQRRRLQFARPEGRTIPLGLGSGALMVAVGLGAYFGYFKHSAALQQAPEQIAERITDMGLTSPMLYLLFAVFLAVPHALLEEYYWRWFVFGQLRRVTPLGLAVVVSSLGFMSHHVIVIQQFVPGHWGAVVFFSLCVALGGAVWAWMYHRTRSLYVAWVSHLLVDCGIMFLGYDLVDW